MCAPAVPDQATTRFQAPGAKRGLARTLLLGAAQPSRTPTPALRGSGGRRPPRSPRVPAEIRDSSFDGGRIPAEEQSTDRGANALATRPVEPSYHGGMWKAAQGRAGLAGGAVRRGGGAADVNKPCSLAEGSRSREMS
ncbi:unnamed protein product [Diplocarpon coronariae]|uniref:Uncharacterized protein n=1 Tax=Diplocarpon coronariae TaxID=2795749 RepID=A0A218YZ03_9HELO|nr:hypothetical protein B2J93_1315 [Marssonina coronariae]